MAVRVVDLGKDPAAQVFIARVVYLDVFVKYFRKWASSRML